MDEQIPLPIPPTVPATPTTLLPEKKIRRCPYCNSEIEVKSPWKALWRAPTLNEWLILFMLVMMLVLVWAYKHDIAICQNFVKNLDTVCAEKQFINISSNITQLNDYCNRTSFNPFCVNFSTIHLNANAAIPNET